MSTWPPNKLNLVGGPLDGAFVRPIGPTIPEVIFVRDIFLATGLVLWVEDPCDPMFPYRYVLDGYTFRHRPLVKV